MISIRILLRGGHVYETSCAAAAPLWNELRAALASGGIAEIRIGAEGQQKGVAIPVSQIVAVETVPAVALKGQLLGRITPAPYIRVPNFLSNEENSAVMGFALRKEREFTASGVETGVLNYRHSQVLMNLSDLDVDFEGRLREVLPDAARYFGMHLPDNYQIEMQMTVHGTATTSRSTMTTPHRALRHAF